MSKVFVGHHAICTHLGHCNLITCFHSFYTLTCILNVTYMDSVKNVDLEAVSKSCKAYQKVRNSPTAVPLHPWVWPTKLWV